MKKEDKIKFQIEFAEIKIRGTYFADREAVTFNTDGFIEWCNDLAGRKIENGN